jgi:diguanylate cyclase (GGDEF)-like protein/PAS domain S-box-containing protein
MSSQQNDNSEFMVESFVDPITLIQLLPNAPYQSLVGLAASICSTPMASFTVLNEERQWIKACVGMHQSETARSDSICTYAMQNPAQLLEISNIQLDPRINQDHVLKKSNTLVFYAGVPIRLSNGEAVGSLCVMDSASRELSSAQKQQLMELAHIAEDMLDSHISKLRADRERMFYRLAVNAVELGLWQYNVHTGKARVNDAFEGIMGLAKGSFGGHVEDFLRAVHPQDVSLITAQFDREMQHNDFSRTEFRVLHPQKGERWLVGRSRPIRNIKGDITHITGIVFDRTEQHEQEAQIYQYQQELYRLTESLENLSRIDALTEVGNRRAFDEHLSSFHSLFVRHQRAYALILLDVDHFKSYNDSFGHPAGDRILKRLANVISSQLRGEDFVARYGGEEFALLVPTASLELAAEVAERLRVSVAQQSWLKSPVTVSLGVAQARLGESVDQLLERADQALYTAKNAGRNRVELAS